MSIGHLQAADDLKKLEESLLSEEKSSRYWQYGWTSFFIADLGVKALIVSNSNQQDKRYDAKIEFVKSSIAAIAMFVRPMNIHKLGDELKKDISKEEKRNIIIQGIAREQRERSFKAHLGSVVLNLAGSLFIWLDDDRKNDALLKFALGMMVGELKIFSSPIKTWQKYQNIDDKSFFEQVSFRPLLNGLALTYSF
jgi:hypothetical protein